MIYLNAYKKKYISFDKIRKKNPSITKQFMSKNKLITFTE